jgi:hypothetical protein
VETDNKYRISASRRDKLKRQYGLTPEDYDKLLEFQNHRCKICNGTETNRSRRGFRALSVDHDHKTGKIRGLLCDNCNHMLGQAGDNPTILLRAIQYLKGNL